MLNHIKKIKHFYSKFLIFLLLSFCASESYSQTDSLNKKRLRLITVSEASVFTAGITALSFAWYADYKQTSFHFFNDNNEWLSMDKFGHAMTSYYTGKLSIQGLKWAGVERRKAIWYGGLYGWTGLLAIEVLDGFSDGWGFSPGDFTANTAGAAILIGQELAWDEQRIILKYSYHDTKYAKYRPSLLGNNWNEKWLKDYNGQTYWLSANISSFLSKESKFPKWLSFSVGYSAEGMTGGDINCTVNEQGQTLPHFDRYRQFYISPDIDLTRIKTRSKTINGFLKIFGFIKFPMPALEFNNQQGVKGHWVYF